MYMSEMNITCTNMYMYVCKCLYMCLHVFVTLYTNTIAHMYMYMYMYKQRYMYSYIHVHKCIQANIDYTCTLVTELYHAYYMYTLLICDRQQAHVLYMYIF